MARLFVEEAAVAADLKLRMSIGAPSGAGKTFDSLIIARELVGSEGKILVIDTEHRSSARYAKDFDFAIVDFGRPFDPRELVDLLKDAQDRYDAIIIDSLSLFWTGPGGILEIVDIAGKGNGFAGWRTGTPIQEQLLDTLISLNCHLIVTVRSKTEYVLEGGKVKKLGTKHLQREDLVYIMDVAIEVDQASHCATVDKTRCSAITDHRYQPNEIKDLAKALKVWLSSSEALEANEAVKLEFKAATTEVAKAVHVPTATSSSNGASTASNSNDDSENSFLEQVTALFQGITREDERAALKNQFVEKFGKPSEISEVSTQAEAVEFVKVLTGASL